MKNKKTVLVIGTVVLVIAALFGIFFSWLFDWGAKGKNTENLPKIIPTPTITEISLLKEAEPDIGLKINADRSGATLTVTKIDNKFSKLEYELIYLAESDGQEIERGVSGGPLEISSSRQVKEDLLFGTESCTTGTCKRHIDKNVKGGVLMIRIMNDEGQGWSTEKKFEITKILGGYEAVWKE